MELKKTLLACTLALAALTTVHAQSAADELHPPAGASREVMQTRAGMTLE